LPFEQLKSRIREVLDKHKGNAVHIAQLLDALGLPHTERKRIRRILKEMTEEGTTVKMRGMAIAIPSNKTEVVGNLRTSGKGFGFLKVDTDDVAAGKPVTVFIPRKYMMDAMNGDRVRARLLGETRKLTEGQILEVLERSACTVVGTYAHIKRGGYVTPCDERIIRNIVTPRPAPEMSLNNGDFVLVRIDDWTSSSEDMRGTILKRIGAPGDCGIDISVAVLSHGVETEFSPQAIQEAEALDATLSENELSRRLDLRELTTFTIDGAGAKDFDDAISISRECDRQWLLGVHIADVSHYVQPGTGLDADASDRSTSIYPIDRVIPMLPHKLSDNICSLRPGEDRFVVSVFMHIDENGMVHEYSIHNAVIRSSYRLIYEDVQAIMDHTASPELIRSIGSLRDRFDELYALRKVLTEMRVKRGALDLDMPEPVIQLDTNGNPVELRLSERLESHRVIEECMLIANEVVATHLWNHHLPCVYRVHEPPDQEKIHSMLPVLSYLGLKFPSRAEIDSKSIQSAINTTAHLPHGFIARRLLLRAMMQARYSIENLEHFGLASKCYCHFTSPIRRYSDLLVHRILKDSIAKGIPSKGFYSPPGALPPEHGIARPNATSKAATSTLPPNYCTIPEHELSRLADHCSEREQRAEQVERDAAQIKTVEYMKRHVGETFDGVISTVLPQGFFVQLNDLPVEGFVAIRNLLDDFYEFNDEKMSYRGKTTGTIIKLADAVTISVLHANTDKMELDFALREHIASEKETPEERKKRTKNFFKPRTQNRGRKPFYRGRKTGKRKHRR